MGKIVRKVIKIGDKPTPEEIVMVNEAYKYPIVIDDDCPAFTYEEMVEMVKKTEEMRNSRKKEIVTLRLPVSVINKAKAVGKGYTGFLSRLVENAINDKDMVSRSL